MPTVYAFHQHLLFLDPSPHNRAVESLSWLRQRLSCLLQGCEDGGVERAWASESAMRGVLRIVLWKFMYGRVGCVSWPSLQSIDLRPDISRHSPGKLSTGCRGQDHTWLNQRRRHYFCAEDPGLETASWKQWSGTQAFRQC